MNSNDWACAVHDYNYLITGGLGAQYSIFDKSGASILTESGLVAADHILVNNVSGPEGAMIQAAISVMNVKRYLNAAF